MASKYIVVGIPDLIRELIHNYRLIAMGCFLAAVGTAIIMLLTESEYRSTANLMPATERSSGLEGLMSGRLGGLAGSLLGGGSKTTFDRYSVLLNSESVKERVIERFNLMDVYETRDHRYPILETKSRLDDMTSFKGAIEGNYLIDVWDTDPKRAQEMAAFYVDLLNEFNSEISVKESRMYREFIESRYQEAMNRADTLRLQLAKFQREFGIYELPVQLETYFSLVGELTSRKIQAEGQMNILEATIGRNSDAFKQAAMQRDVIQKNIDELYASKPGDPVLLNLGSLPDIGTSYFQLLQEIELHVEILKYVTPIYEHAKLEEAKSLPLVTVIDAPRVAEKKDRPGRTINVLIATLSVFLMMCFYVLTRRIYVANRVYFRSFFNPS
jgi:tyrosine-protein kinase Etk/Wzc